MRESEQKEQFDPPELVVYGSIQSRTAFKCPQGLGGKNEVGNDNFDMGVCGSAKPSAKKTN